MAIFGLVKRGWRLIVVAVAICLTASVIILVRTKTVYKSSARLLVLQQGGRPSASARAATRSSTCSRRTRWRRT